MDEEKTTRLAILVNLPSVHTLLLVDDMKKYKVGDTVWVQHIDNPERGRLQTVTKVGKKWVTLDTRIRFDSETGEVDAGKYTPMEEVFPDEEAARYEQFRKEAWIRFYREVKSSYGVPPEGLTLEDIEHMTLILRKGSA